MKEGKILVRGNSAGRDGAQMTGGKIILCGRVPEILPTFSIHDIKSNLKFNDSKLEDVFFQFLGDSSEGGKGKIS